MRVLLVVDLQNDFCPGGALAVPEGDKIVDTVNSLMRYGKYDLLVATQDWHPADHKSFAANWPGKQVGDVVDLNGVEQLLWPVHCVRGSQGAKFHSDFDVGLIDAVIQKGADYQVDSYSAFFDNAHKNETPLREAIEQKIATNGAVTDQIQIDVCGLALDYCVKFTALDAADLGYKTRVIFDATRAVSLSPDDEMRTLHELAKKNVEVVTSGSIIAALRTRRDLQLSLSR